MTREIKFRAWEDVGTKDTFRMTYNVGILPTIGGYNENGFGLFLHPKDYKLMQFTGLKDKNGKEIYEGDIVKTSNKDFNFEIGFTEGYFYILGRDNKAYELRKYNQEAEIIGNVYENPELLTNQS